MFDKSIKNDGKNMKKTFDIDTGTNKNKNDSSINAPFNNKSNKIQLKTEIKSTEFTLKDQNISNFNYNLIKNDDVFYYKFYIFSDLGTCVYNLNSSEIDNNVDDNNEQSMQGIIQALFLTSMELNCEINLISTNLGSLIYKSYSQNNLKTNVLLLAIILPNFFADEELCQKVVQRMLDFIYHSLIVSIGIDDLYKFSSSAESTELKQKISLYSKSIEHIIKNYDNLSYLLLAKEQVHVDKDVVYSIKFYMEKLLKKLDVEFICLTINDIVLYESEE